MTSSHAHIPALPHWVYLFTDADGAAVYVGSTVDIERRAREHATNAPWWAGVDDMVRLGPFDRRAALGIERELIAELDPPANSHGTTRDARKHTAGAA